MLAALFGSASPAPRVEISIARELVVIPPTPDGDLTSTPSLSGVVTVLLPTPQRADRLFVTLEGKVELYASGWASAEKSVILQKKVVELPLGEEELAAGNHVFAFAIDVPPSTPVELLSPHGRVTHSLRGILELPARSPISSLARPIFINAVPFYGDFPPPFEMSHEHVSEDLGPVRVQVFSPHLAVGSLVHLRIFLPSVPPTPVYLQSIQLSLSQSFTINYANPSRARNPPPEAHSLLYLDTSTQPPTTSKLDLPDIDLQPGGEWEHTAVFRVGKEEEISSSSVVGRNDPIQVAHKLLIELRYFGGTSGKKGVQGFVLELPVHMGGCSTIQASWSLPQYASSPPNTRVKHTRGTLLCLCEYDEAEMMDIFGEALEAGGERVERVPVIGVEEEDRVRANKSPAMPT